MRFSVYRPLVGFFGAQSAAGVGVRVGGGRRLFSCVCDSLSSGMSQLSNHPSMPGPNLGASQIGLDLGLGCCSVCDCLSLKKEKEVQNECWTLTSGWAGQTHTHARTQSVNRSWKRRCDVGCVVTKEDKKEAGRMRTQSRGGERVAKLLCLDIQGNFTENADCRALSCSLPMSGRIVKRRWHLDLGAPRREHQHQYTQARASSLKMDAPCLLPLPPPPSSSI